MKSYHERYFENYKAEVLPAQGGKKRRTVYTYIGPWIQWEADGRSLKQQKILYLLLEGGNIALFLWAAFRYTGFNSMGPVAAFGISSIVPWLLEITGVIRFLTGKEYITELSQEEIQMQIRGGGFIRALLLGIGTAAGTAAAIRDSSMDGITLMVILAYALCVCFSLLLAYLQKKMFYRTFRNLGGKAGDEY